MTSSAIIIPIAHPTRECSQPKSWKRKSKRPHQHYPHGMFDAEFGLHHDKYAKPLPFSWDDVEWGEVD